MEGIIMIESFVVGNVVEETIIIYDSRNNIEVGTLTRRITMQLKWSLSLI